MCLGARVAVSQGLFRFPVRKGLWVMDELHFSVYHSRLYYLPPHTFCRCLIFGWRSAAPSKLLPLLLETKEKIVFWVGFIQHIDWSL